ncbi:ribonuclease domain-containing protein [Actinoallomurus acanthiterrae]
MHTRLRPHSSWPGRIAVTLAATASVAGMVGTTPASASVYKSCKIAKCVDAAHSAKIWASKGYPTRRGWYPWKSGKYNFTGGRFQNREGELPKGATYSEYDVYPRTKGAHRDAFRIVVNRKTHAVWFSPDHYKNFYKLNLSGQRI